MSSWSDGYVTDVAYTRSFFKELAPAFLDYVAVINGLEPPPGSSLGGRAGDGFSYCELACGNGVTTSFLAAANPAGDFHGIDFMPAHISSARRLAEDGAARNVTFHEISFEEALDRSFPQFDYIVLHGIYSWVSAKNRQNILAFIQRNLKSGGLVYVSYNTLPGWAGIGPFQHFALAYSDVVQGDSLTKVREAVAVMRTLKEAGARVFQSNAALAGHMDGLDRMPVAYLAHEYLNQDWAPLYVSEAMRDFAGVKCSYVGSATLVENHLSYVLNEVQRTLVAKQPNRELRELVKDYLLNQRFRRDVYARGALKLGASGRDEALQRMHFALDVPPEQVRYQARVPVGQIAFDTPVARQIALALADGPKTLGAIAARPEFEGRDVQDLIRNLQALIVTGQARPVAAMTDASARGAAAMREAVLQRLFTEEQITSLPSACGTAFAIGVLDQAMLREEAQGSAEAMAKRVHALLAKRNMKVTAAGKPVAGEGDALTTLEEQASRFLDKGRPWMSGLGLTKAA